MAALFDKLTDPKLLTLLEDGGIGVLPTDTVYGLVCEADKQIAVERLYSLKNRITKLGTLIAADVNQLVRLGFKRRYLKAVEQFWPGPVSVVVPFSDPNLRFLHQGLPSIPVRIPDDRQLLTLLKKTGPLLTTSANLPDGPPANTVQEAKVYFGTKVDFYVNGGNLEGRQPSTIVRIVDDAVEVLREGAVKIN